MQAECRKLERGTDLPGSYHGFCDEKRRRRRPASHVRNSVHARAPQAMSRCRLWLNVAVGHIMKLHGAGIILDAGHAATPAHRQLLPTIWMHLRGRTYLAPPLATARPREEARRSGPTSVDMTSGEDLIRGTLPSHAFPCQPARELPRNSPSPLAHGPIILPPGVSLRSSSVRIKAKAQPDPEDGGPRRPLASARRSALWERPRLRSSIPPEFVSKEAGSGGRLTIFVEHACTKYVRRRLVTQRTPAASGLGQARAISLRRADIRDTYRTRPPRHRAMDPRSSLRFGLPRAAHYLLPTRTAMDTSPACHLTCHKAGQNKDARHNARGGRRKLKSSVDQARLPAMRRRSSMPNRALLEVRSKQGSSP